MFVKHTVIAFRSSQFFYLFVANLTFSHEISKIFVQHAIIILFVKDLREESWSSWNFERGYSHYYPLISFTSGNFPADYIRTCIQSSRYSPSSINYDWTGLASIYLMRNFATLMDWRGGAILPCRHTFASHFCRII